MTKFDSTELPALEQRTQCVLIARDPHYIYAYWDYTEHDIDRVRNELKFESEDIQLVLRVHDVTGNHTWDLDVGFSTKNWYIHVWQDNSDYYAKLGIRGGNDHFVPLTQSNTAHTPPASASKRNDLIWQEIKAHKESQPYIEEAIKSRYKRYHKFIEQSSKKKTPQRKQAKKPRVYHLTAQDIRAYYMHLFARVSRKGRKALQSRLQAQGQALSMEELLKGRLGGISWQKVRPLLTFPDLIKHTHTGASENKAGPESLSSFKNSASDVRLNKRKFFFEIWAEVIVYGRTEANATVTLNQKGVKLNPDGTFSMRYALPDGEIPFKFIAQSSDGIEQRHIYTRVEREKTIGFPKMLK